MLKLEAPLEELNDDGLTALLGQVELLRRRILHRLDGPEEPAPQPEPAPGLLSIEEAAARIRMSTSWLYREAPTLPFARKISNRWRFDARGLEKYLRTRG